MASSFLNFRLRGFGLDIFFVLRSGNIKVENREREPEWALMAFGFLYFILDFWRHLHWKWGSGTYTFDRQAPSAALVCSYCCFFRDLP